METLLQIHAAQTAPAITPLEAFLIELVGIPHSQNPQLLEAKSKDYYWYSPLLQEMLGDKRGEVCLRPESEAEVVRIAAAAARHGICLTPRGGGTGNYGQCVPLEGGAVLDMTGLCRVLSIAPGSVQCEAGIMILALEQAVRADDCVPGGQELLMYPSTRDIATIGGFVGGGYGGAGSIRNGILKDPGNVTQVRVVTVEAVPRTVTLDGADIQKVHHAFGTNGIMVSLTLSLKPAVEWIHHIALLDSYSAALQLGVAACEAVARTVPIGNSRTDSLDSAAGEGSRLDAFLITAVDRRFSTYYQKEFGKRFPANKDAVFSMVHPDYLPEWRTLVAQFGGIETMALTEAELTAQNLIPAFECGWNHTTLMALRHDRSWTNLQTIDAWPLNIALVEKQMARWGDEVVMHHEFGRDHNGPVVFGLPLVAYFDKNRLYEIIAEYEADGCVVLDNHVFTIEGGGMKQIDDAQIAFKKVADPHGLMNPGKTEGWSADMAVALPTPSSVDLLVRIA